MRKFIRLTFKVQRSPQRSNLPLRLRISLAFAAKASPSCNLAVARGSVQRNGLVVSYGIPSYYLNPRKLKNSMAPIYCLHNLCFTLQKQETTHRFFQLGDQSILLLSSSAQDIIFCSQSMLNFNGDIGIWARGSLQDSFTVFLTATSLLRTWTKTIAQLAFVTMGTDWQTNHLDTERKFSIMSIK